MWVWSENNGRARSWGTFLGSQHFEGKGACWSSGMELRRMTCNWSITRVCTNQITSWLVHNLSTFGARTSHGQPQTHKTHHGLDLGEATTFPLIIFLCLSTRATSKWHFVLGLPNGSLEIPTTRIPTTLGPHNFAFRPPIAMRFQPKL
jgi:hypothetical protein